MMKTYNYKNLQNSWKQNSECSCNCNCREDYSGPVTLSYPEWIDYLDQGKNVLYGSGGVIPGGTVNLPFGASGSVYKGQVKKYGMYN